MGKREPPKSKNAPPDPSGKGGRALERVQQHRKARGLPAVEIDSEEGELDVNPPTAKSDKKSE